MITLGTQSWSPAGPDTIHGMRRCCASQLAVCHAGRYGLMSVGMECQLSLRRFARGLGHVYTDIYADIYADLHTYMCMYLCMHMCTYVYMCIHVRLSTRSLTTCSGILLQQPATVRVGGLVHLSPVAAMHVREQAVQVIHSIGASESTSARGMY